MPPRSLRLALRRLTNARGFAITAVLTVALAIGANGMIFSAVRGLLIRPLPFEDGDRLVWIYGQERGAAGSLDRVTGEEADGLADQRAIYEGVAVIGDRSFIRVTGDRRERWNGLWVTPDLFGVLEVEPAIGRRLTLDDAVAETPPIMIGYERWQRDLGGDPSVIGQPIHFYDGHTFIIVGVLPPELEFPFGRMPQSGNGTGFNPGVQDFWILGQESAALPGGTAIARLRRGVSTTLATSEARSLGTRLSGALPSATNRSLAVVPMREQSLGLVGPGLRLAQGFAVLMLVLACANLVTLTLLRTYAREREIAVHAALGAGARTIAWDVASEVAAVVLAGGILGLILSTFAREAIGALAAGSVPMIDRIVVDWAVVINTIVATAIVALVASIAPAVVIARGNLYGALLGGGGQTTKERTRVRGVLVAAQIALAMVLSVGAALLTTSFARLLSVDAGYDSRGVITADVELFDHPNPGAFYSELHRRLMDLPGVEAVGLIQSTPLTGKWTFTEPFVIVGRPDDPATAPAVSGAFVAFDYFAAMGTPLVMGRAFTADEYLAGDAPALIINESAARRFFPEGSPLDESVVIAGKPRRIVGVVKDMRDVRLDTPAEAQWYQPLFGSGTQLIVRTSGDAATNLPRLRNELLAADRRFIVNRLGTLDDIIAGTVVERRMAMRLLASLAAIALAMAAIGVQGVVSFNVGRRRHEFGIRSALGAQRRALIALVLRDGLTMAATGIAVGILLSVWASGALEHLLFEVSPTDPLALAAIAALLLLMTVVASVVPAWRAATVDPVTALRAE